MKRSKPLTRKTPLAQGKPLVRKTPLSRGTTAPRQRPLRRPKMPSEIREAVVARAAGRCDYCGRPMPAGVEDAHHRKLRTRGGKDTIENLVAVHHHCHMWIHEHPADSTTLGFMVSSWNDEEEIPVFLHQRKFHLARTVWSAT